MNVYDLGTYARSITCANDTAKQAFDQGLVWLFGYNHEAAAACFEEAIAAEADAN